MDQTTAISRAAANAPVTQAELAAAFMPAAAEAVRQSPDLAGAPAEMVAEVSRLLDISAAEGRFPTHTDCQVAQVVEWVQQEMRAAYDTATRPYTVALRNARR